MSDRDHPAIAGRRHSRGQHRLGVWHPTQWDLANGVTAISGVKSNGHNVFADSPPIDGEVYLITSFQIGYAALAGSFAPMTAETINTELALVVGSDVVWRGVDTEIGADIDTGTNGPALVNGAFSADLNNPIAVTSADRLSLRLGLSNAGAGVSGTAMLGVQIAATGAGAWSATPYPSSLTYQLVNRTRT